MTNHTRNRNTRFPPIHLDPTLPRSQNLANAINTYWGSGVAVPVGDNNVTSRMQYGVPVHAINDNTYSHPDVVHVKWYGRDLKITRRL